MLTLRWCKFKAQSSIGWSCLKAHQPTELHGLKVTPVIIVRGVELVLRSQDEEDVGMGQAALLKFNDMAVGDDAAQDAVLDEVGQQRLEPDVESASQEVRPVGGLLPREERTLYLCGESGRRCSAPARELTPCTQRSELCVTVGS